EPFANCAGTAIRELLIVVVRPPGVRVSLDAQSDLRVLIHELLEAIEHFRCIGVRFQIRSVVLEVDLTPITKLSALVELDLPDIQRAPLTGRLAVQVDRPVGLSAGAGTCSACRAPKRRGPGAACQN